MRCRRVTGDQQTVCFNRQFQRKKTHFTAWLSTRLFRPVLTVALSIELSALTLASPAPSGNDISASSPSAGLDSPVDRAQQSCIGAPAEAASADPSLAQKVQRCWFQESALRRSPHSDALPDRLFLRFHQASGHCYPSSA